VAAAEERRTVTVIPNNDLRPADTGDLGCDPTGYGSVVAPPQPNQLTR
jgi:hypothetical protein